VGKELGLKVKNEEAIPFFKRAVELDPNFAIAYAWLSASYGLTGQTELGIEAEKRAFDLRERVSELDFRHSDFDRGEEGIREAQVRGERVIEPV